LDRAQNVTQIDFIPLNILPEQFISFEDDVDGFLYAIEIFFSLDYIFDTEGFEEEI
jgi:hypothetical protein